VLGFVAPLQFVGETSSTRVRSTSVACRVAHAALTIAVVHIRRSITGSAPADRSRVRRVAIVN